MALATSLVRQVMSLVTVLASIAQRIPPPKVERKDSESAGDVGDVPYIPSWLVVTVPYENHRKIIGKWRFTHRLAGWW